MTSLSGRVGSINNVYVTSRYMPCRIEREMEEQALAGVLLLPASARGLYYGKVIANWAQLALLGAGLDRHRGDGPGRARCPRTSLAR